MKTPFIALALYFTAPLCIAENLTQADREALLEKLEQMRAAADSKVDARFRAAISAYKSGMSSEDAAIDLYLKCEELVNFDEKQKKSGDFRDWKRKNAEKISDKKFKLALRQQLRWLVLTLEAASKDPDRDKLAVEAATILDSIISQAEDLRPHRGVLEQSVTSSVFARAYDITGVEVKNWPMAPIQVQQIYDQVMLPPLRNPDRLAALRATWIKRMIHESTLADMWSGNPDDKKKDGIRSPEYEKFVTEKLPQLQWAAEIDLYKAGDERAAALRMLAHIEKNITHESAPKWAEQFTGLLNPAQEEVADGEIAP